MYNIIEYKNINFFIMSNPDFIKVDKFILILNKFNIKNIFTCVNLNFKNYIISKMKDINIYELIYDDGTFPNNIIISKWIYNLNMLLTNNKSNKFNIAILCTSGLGRSPLLAAIALIELYNFTPINSIKLIRKNNHRYLNKNQIEQLMKYKKMYKKNIKSILNYLFSYIL